MHHCMWGFGCKNSTRADSNIGAIPRHSRSMIAGADIVDIHCFTVSTSLLRFFFADKKM